MYFVKRPCSKSLVTEAWLGLDTKEESRGGVGVRHQASTPLGYGPLYYSGRGGGQLLQVMPLFGHMGVMPLLGHRSISRIKGGFGGEVLGHLVVTLHGSLPYDKVTRSRHIWKILSCDKFSLISIKTIMFSSLFLAMLLSVLQWPHDRGSLHGRLELWCGTWGVIIVSSGKTACFLIWFLMMAGR